MISLVVRVDEDVDASASVTSTDSLPGRPMLLPVVAEDTFPESNEETPKSLPAPLTALGERQGATG